MAFTSNESIVVNYYIASLGRSPDKAGLTYWAGELTNGNKTQAQVRDFFMDQSIPEVAARFPAGQSNEDTVASVYNSVLGRVADAEGKAYWTSRLDGTNTDGQPALSGLGELLDALVGAATATNDAASLANKQAAAQYFIDNAVDGMTPPSTDSINDNATTLNTVKDSINSDAIANGSVPGVKGDTLMLTKGLDNLTGTADNDEFIGAIDAGNVELNTTSALDTIDGGAGIDTFKLSSTTAINANMSQIPTLENVEILSVLGTAAVGLNTTAIEDLTKVEITKATTVAVTASDAQTVDVAGATGATITVDGGKDVIVSDKTTDNDITIGATTGAAGKITVTDTKLNDGEVKIDGGTDVTVTTTSDTTATGGTDGDITIGGDGTPIAPTGDVKVTHNLNSDGVAAFAAGDIAITGGKTVDVTVNATTTAKTNTSDNDITIGTTTVTGDSKTTDVTVTQNKTEVTKTADTVAQVDASSVVTFVKMAKGETTTVNGLTFEASKALTAEEVAQAFANLTLNDTQTPTGPVANGFFTNGSTTKAWTSADASGATVTFTNANAGQVAAATTTHNLVVSDTAAAGNVAAVTTAGTAKSGGDFATNAVNYGAVVVDDHATEAIKTITVDGFASATLGGGGSLDALTTLNIANNTAGGNTTLTSTSTTLALSVDNITSTTSVVNVGASVNNLTIGATGKASTFDLTASALKDLTINADAALDIKTTASGYATTNLKTVDVNGTAKVDLGALTGSKLNTFDASGNTGGVTATVNTATANLGTIKDYIFSEGNDVVTLNETAVNANVTLGAGDDKITLKTGTQSLNKVIDAGTGTDTLVMDFADAEAASSTTTFEAKIDGFEKLSIIDTANTATEVNLDNMDNISYVVTAGATATAGAASTEVATVTFANITAGQTITIDGVTATAVANVSAAELEAAFDSATPTDLANKIVLSGTDAGNWSGADDTATTVAFTSQTADTNVTDLDPVEGNAGVGTNATATTGVQSDPANIDDETVTWDFTGASLAVGQQITFNGLTLTAKAAMNATAIAADFAAAIAGGAGNYTNSVASGTFAALADTATFTAEDWTASGTSLLITDTGGNTAGGGAVGNGNQDYSATAALAITLGTAAANTTALAVSTVDGVSLADAAVPNLTLKNMLNDGTVELTTANATGGVKVVMKDATGTTDSLNVVLSDSLTAAGVNVGKVSVDDVETVNVTANDAFTDTTGALDGNGTAIADGKDDTNAAHTLSVAGDAVKTINVDGAGDVSLSTTSAVIATVNASNLTGKLTLIVGVDDMTVTGGSAGDTFNITSDDVTINGGAGNDVFNITAGSDRATLTGGEGNDTFNVIGASATSSTYAKITAVDSGDVIRFAHDHDGGTTNPDTVADSFTAAQIKLAEGATETTQALMDLAINTLGANDLGWFQTAGNTFIVMDVQDGGTAADGTAGFVDGEDMVVMINGLVDLSTASFNATEGTIEIA